MADRAVFDGTRLRVVGERLRRLVSLLHLKTGKVNARTEHARGRSRFEAAKRKTQLAQRLAQVRRREKTVRPALIRNVADVNFSREEGPRREDHGPGPVLGLHARCQQPLLPLAFKGNNLRLFEQKVRLRLKRVLHNFAVLAPVNLRAKRVHRRSLAEVEHAALDRRGVGGASHFSAERVNLAYQMALCRSADRRVARTVSHSIHINCE